MYIPPKNLAGELKKQQIPENKIRLKSSHLLIDKDIVSAIFKSDSNVNLVYYPNRHTMLLAPTSDELFKDLHKAGKHILKDRNLRGDKSIAIHEILIDHQIEDSDRDLAYEVQPGLGILKVQL